jgi:hypothetical protein
VSTPVAAAQVQDALASARRKQFNYGRAEVGDEAGVAGVAFRIPGLCVYHFLQCFAVPDQLISVFDWGGRDSVVCEYLRRYSPQPVPPIGKLYLPWSKQAAQPLSYQAAVSNERVTEERTS